MPRNGSTQERAAFDQACGRRSITGQWAADINLDHHGQYIVKGLIPSSALVQIYGAAYSGESAAMLDLGCHVAAEMPYRGKRTRHGPVAIIALENPASIEARIVAWCQHTEIDRSKLRVYIARGSLNLLDSDSVEAAIRELAEAGGEEGFILVLIDTQSRATPGARENDAEDMGLMVESCDLIRHRLNATVGLIHHTGKDTTQGARGSSVQLAAVDVAIEVADHQMIVRKQRDGIEGETIPFDLVPVPIGYDEDNDPVTAVVAVEPDATVRRQRATPKLTGYAATAMVSLRELIADKGEVPGISAMPPGAKAVRVQAWRDDFSRRVGDDKDAAAIEKGFYRAREKLVGGSAPLVGLSKPWVWMW